MNRPDSQKLTTALVGLLAAWFLVVLFAAYLGVFAGGTRYSMSVPLPLGLAAVVPIAVFALLFRSSSRFREHLLSLNPVIVTTAHIWRIGGISFLILLAKGLLPPVFALPAGLGDMAIGVTAPFVASALAQNRLSTRSFVRWQMAGIADLALAVTLGVLSSTAHFGIFAHGVTTSVMGQIPMVLIPAFAVPFLVILHIVCIAQARHGLRDNPALFAAEGTA